MEKTDIRMYSDEELSLLVMNEEPLYKVMLRAVSLEKFSHILSYVDELFLFTDAQKQDLEDTFKDELEDYLDKIDYLKDRYEDE